MNYIIDPNSKLAYYIFSKKGIALLKSYISTYQNGGKSKRKSKRNVRVLPPDVNENPVPPVADKAISFTITCINKQDIIFKVNNISFRIRFARNIMIIYIPIPEKLDNKETITDEEKKNIKALITFPFFNCLAQVTEFIDNFDFSELNSEFSEECIQLLLNLKKASKVRFPQDIFDNDIIQKSCNKITNRTFDLEEDHPNFERSKLIDWSKELIEERNLTSVTNPQNGIMEA